MSASGGSGLRRGARVVPATPSPPISRPFLNNGTPPGDPASPLSAVKGGAGGTIGSPFGPERPLVMYPECGFLKRLMSEKERFEKFTPSRGPGGRLRIPGGKFCCTMNPAVL